MCNVNSIACLFGSKIRVISFNITQNILNTEQEVCVQDLQSIYLDIKSPQVINFEFQHRIWYKNLEDKIGLLK